MSVVRILGNNKKTCDGLSRRDLIHAGGLAFYGLTLADVLALQTAAQAAPAARGRTFGKAKSVIVLFLYGSPPQLDTWDMKPDAPQDIRGPFKPIRTSNPSIDIVIRTHSDVEFARLREQEVGRIIMGEQELARAMLEYALRRLGVPPDRARLLVEDQASKDLAAEAERR